MSVETRTVTKFDPSRAPSLDALLNDGRVAPGRLWLGGDGEEAHYQTTGFGLRDGWSRHARAAVRTLDSRGFFNNQPVVELGAGDFRLLRIAGTQAVDRVGVEIQDWRLVPAYHNTAQWRADGTPHQLLVGDGLDYLGGQNNMKGRLLACLPQSFEADKDNTADGIPEHPALPLYDYWKDRGLPLLAATLDLARKANKDKDLQVMLIVSDRVRESDRQELFNETGWKITHRFRTSRRVRQDWDTGVAYVDAIDDGKRFSTKPKGEDSYVSAKEAEKLRQLVVTGEVKQEDFHVYHHVWAVVAKPR